MPRGLHTSSHPNYTWRTLSIDNCGDQSADFLLDTGATYYMLTEAPGPLSPQSTSIMGLSRWSKSYDFSCLLSCNWDSVLFSQESLVAQSPPHPLGKGYSKHGSCLCFHEYGALSFSPTNWTKCKSYNVVWWKNWVEHRILFLLLSNSKTLTYFHIKSSIHWNPMLRKG